MDENYELYHHGVKGMKWGRRRGKQTSGMKKKHPKRREYRTKEILKKSAITNGKRWALAMLAAEGAVTALVATTNPAYAVGSAVVNKMVGGAIGSITAASIMMTAADVAVDAVSTYRHNKEVDSRKRRRR